MNFKILFIYSGCENKKFSVSVVKKKFLNLPNIIFSRPNDALGLFVHLLFILMNRRHFHFFSALISIDVIAVDGFFAVWRLLA